jgi:hypothetical protein
MTIRLHGNASRTLLYALVIVMVAAVYIPALRGAFISDDNDLIRARQAILVRSDGWRDVIRHGFWWESGNEAANPRLYRPWTSLTYWLDYQVGGLSPTAFRVSNYVVHLANTALIAVVLSGYVGTATALWIAALCGVAPVGLTSVGWIGGS